MKRLSLLLAVILVASCSPKVVTRLSTPLAPLNVVEQVRVTEDIPPPQDAQFLGTVEVSDSGFSTNCSYDEVVALAVAEVRKAGGNYLHIEAHRWPDWVSTCHWIAGSIFYVDHAPPAAHAPDALASDGEPQLRPMGQDDILPSTFVPPAIPEPEYKLGKWRFALDVAYSYRTAKIGDNPSGGELSDSEWKEFMRGLLGGVSYGASITGFFNTVYGLGAKFTGNSYSNRGLGVDTYYIAPELLMRIPNRDFKNMWIFSFSAGYVAYNESIKDGSTSERVESVGGIKSVVEVGYDFRIAQGVYLGLKLAASVGGVRLKDADGKNIMNSLQAIEIGGGIRF